MDTVDPVAQPKTMQPPKFQLQGGAASGGETEETTEKVSTKETTGASFDAPDGGSGAPPGGGDPPKAGQAMPVGYAQSLNAGGTKVGILGEEARDLAFNYMGEYWEELKKKFKLEDFLIAAVKDLLDLIGIDLIRGATAAVSEAAAKLAGNIAQITRVVGILVKIKEWIDRVPKPIKEFLKYLLGFFMKKVSKWISDEGMEDKTINTIVFGAGSVMDAFGGAIAKLEALLGKLNGYIAAGIEKIGSIPGVKAAGSWLYSTFGSYIGGDQLEAAGGKLKGAVTDLWTETKKLKPTQKENKAAELDLKFLWLKVKSPEVQKWNEKDAQGKEKEMGGMVLDSQLGIRLSGNDFEADITVKINYSGDYRFKLESESVLMADGVGIDGLFNVAGLTLSKLEMSSEQGLSLLIVKLARLAFGPDVLVGENLRLQYKKGSKTPLEMDGDVELNALGRTLNGNLHLGFNEAGGLGKGKFFVTTGSEEFELIKDHLKIKNINAEGDWEDGKFKELMVKGDPDIGFAGARVTGSKVGLEYKDGEGFAGKADELLIQVDIMGATVGIKLQDATVEENGFSAEKVTLTYTGAAAKQQAGEESTPAGGEEDKVGLIKDFVPAFELGWLTGALGIDIVELDITKAHIGWGKQEAESGAETPQTQGQEAEGSTGAVTQAKTKTKDDSTAKEGDEKQNVFTLRRLKASLFGITVDGAYKDETKTFEGTISSKLFGQDSGRKPATFSVQGKEEGAWEATIQSLALLPSNKAFGNALNVGPIVLNNIVIASGEGIKSLELQVDKFGVMGDVLAAEGLLLQYSKDKGVLDTKAKIFLKMFEGNPRLSADLALQFGTDGSLISGSAIKERGGDQFELFNKHLLLSNPNFNAQFSGKDGLKSLMVNGDIGLKLPGAKVSATEATFNYDKAEKVFKAHVDQLSGKLRLGEETLIMVLVEGADIDQKGIRAESIKLTFSYGDEEAPMEDLEALTKAGDLSKLIPGFNSDLIKSVGGIDTFVMDLTTTNVGYDFADKDGKEGEGEVKKASEDSKKKSETKLAIRKLKAHAFGFDIMGKYEEGKFNGSFHSEDFGGGDFEVNTTDPEKWVARASEVDLKFGGRKLFNLFGMERVQLHEIEYVSGHGIQILNLSVHKLDFGNGMFKTNKIDGKLTDKGLEFAGTGVELDVFGYKLAGAFKVNVDKEGKPTEIRATLDGATDIEAIKDVLKFTGLGGSVDWVDGSLENMELHAGMGLKLPAGVSLDVPQAKFGYAKAEGMFAKVDEMRLGIRISEDLQLLFRMQQGKVSKDGAGGVGFSAEKLAATFAYGREIISPQQDVSKEKLQALLPGIPTKWLEFAGLRVLVFTAAANQVKLGKNGLEIGNWQKVVEALEGEFMGMEVGYNGGNAEVGLGEGIGGMVENQLDKNTTGGQGSQQGLETNGGLDSTGKKPMGPGGWVRGNWNKEAGIPAIGMSIPLLPGLNVGGGINAAVGVGATLGAGIEKLPDLEEGKERFKLSGDAAVRAFGDLKVELFASVGHELIIAIQAGLFAKASISASAKGAVSGVLLWDREKNKMALSKRQEDKPRVDVDLKAALSATVGAEIKAKAFIFFEKKLWSYEFKKWDLGEWIMKGSLEADENGDYKWNRIASGFGKDGGIPKAKPDVDAKVVTPLEVLQGSDKIEDQRMVWRIYHDIMAPGSGYTPEQQLEMAKQLKSMTKIDFSKEEGDFATMMSEMRGRQASGDPSNMMTRKEWESYSDTDSGFWIFKHESARKKIKAVDMKLAEYHAAADVPSKMRVLEGTLTDAEIAENLPDIDLENPTKKPKHRAIFERAGLVQMCDLFLLKNSDSSRRDMVAKLRSDAATELRRLKTLPPDDRRRN
jgi:hypothetical protein